jgi:hypothetical protein
MDAMITGLTASTAALFAALTFRQYWQRRKSYQLIWSIGLANFAISVGMEFLLQVVGEWTPAMYKTWYYLGAMLGSVYLGQGTMYLLANRKVANMFMVLLALVTIYGGFLMYTAPLALEKVYPNIPSGEALPSIRDAGFGSPRAWTPFLNIYGTLCLGGGALYSAWLYRKKKMGRERAIGNVMIAVGTFVVAGVSTLNRFGYPKTQYIGELIAITIIFLGFLKTIERPEEVVTPSALAVPEKLSL